MEPVSIELSAAVFARLQSYAKPLLDTPDTVLTRVFDHYDATAPRSETLTAPTPKPEKKYFITSRGVRLPIGVKLFASYRGKSLRADITESGIEYNGTTYEDPSSAARAAKIDSGASETAASTNGWVFWMLPKSVLGVITSIDIYRQQTR